MSKKTPTGIDIQKALLDELKVCSPYVKKEVFQFDFALFIPKGGKFIADKPESFHCWFKFRRKYCKKEWDEAVESFKIPEEEYERRLAESRAERDKLREQGKDYFNMPYVPEYRYNDKEYKWSDELWKTKAKNEVAICHQDSCEWYKNRQKEMDKRRKKYGFMNGLHLFEVKSDLDDHSRLIYQIPNMLGIADYVWLVLGENQTVPEWLPPYIGIIRHNSKTNKFKIEHYNRTKLYTGHTYRHCFKDIGLTIENEEVYAFARLERLWTINSMFRFMFDGQKVVDMEEEIKILLKFLKRSEKAIKKGKFGNFQKNLFDFKGDKISKKEEVM